MKRREFIGTLGTALAATCAPITLTAASGKLHIVTLSFDDGFKKSFLRTAEIYEKFGLSACFNIVAGAHLPGTVVVDDYMPREQFGDFGVWNELQEKSKELILKSLDVFSKELRGFDPKKAVFNFPYNESTPELEEWLPSVVMAFRARGGMLNPIPGPDTHKVTTGGWGPGNAEKHVDETIEKLLAQPEGWMVYNLHGMDEEGWGPIRPAYLERLLGRLRQIESVRMIPTGRALMQAKAGSFANR